MEKLIDPKKKNSIMVGENTATPSDIAELFGRNPDMTNYVAPQAAAQTVAQPTATYGQRMQQEADASQARVDDYFKKNPMTGDVFKDIGGLLATREDRRRATKAREYMEAEEGRGVTRRGQDIQLELGRGGIGVNTEQNRINEKGIDVQRELGLGALAINNSILSMQQDRYNNITKPSDKLAMAERAAGARIGAAEAGFELSDNLFKETSKYLKDGKPAVTDSVAAPATSAVTPATSTTVDSLAAADVPAFSGYSPYPDILEATPITHYGKGIMSQIGGAAVEGGKLLGRTAARIRNLDPLSTPHQFKRKVNK